MNKEEIKGAIQQYIQQGLLKEAEEILLQYKNIIGYDDEIASMETIIKIYEKNYTEALVCIQEGLKFNIFNGDLYFTMGNVYEIQGHYNRAYLCYEYAKEYASSEENKNTILETINNLKSKYNVKVNNCSIVILTYNNLDYTKICIESIKRYNSNENYEIIIVDNHSTDGTVEWIKQQEGIKYILNEENKGFPAGCNQGIEIAEKNNDIFLLNNDTVIMPNSIFNLRMGLYLNENIGATGPVSNSVFYYQQIDEQYNDFNGYMDFALKNNITNEYMYEKRLKLVGFAMLIKRDALNKVGLLDERFTPGNYEDDDLSLRILIEGYKLLLCKDSYIHHFGGISFRRDIDKYNMLLEKNIQKFKEKWGFMNEEAVDMRFDLLKKIDTRILRNDQEINILDIGCGLGGTLIKIKEIIPNANIYGIEKSKEIISIIKDLNILTEVQHADNVDFKNLIFDVIILSKEEMHNCINNLTSNISDSSQVIRENEIKNQENIQFTGERLVINDFVRDNYNDVMQEHLSRYKLASKYVKDKIVIDAASGTGYGSLILSKAGAKSVSGFDISKEAVDSARQNYVDCKNIKFEVGDVTKLNVPDSSAEVFVSFETIEHINCGEDLIREASRILNEDGIFIVSTPNRSATNPGLLSEEKPQNIYHSFEYSPLEFIGNLSTEFDIVELYGQTVNENIEFIKNKCMRQIFGRQEVDYSSINNIKDYECRKINEFKNFEPMYLVAICKKKNNGNIIKNTVNGIRKENEEHYFIGENCDIRGKEKISFGDGVFVQENCWINIAYDNPLQDIIIDIRKEANIGRRSIISASNKVVIGEKVLIAPNVYIADCGHEFSDINMPIIDQGISSCTNEVVIERGSWIGTNSVIVGNVNIGANCVIGANSFVNRDIPDYSVAVGSPAKIIKMFDTIDKEWKAVANEGEIENILKRREEAKYRIPIKQLKSLQVEVSSICNLKCPQCFNNIKGHKSAILSKIIWEEKVRTILPQLTDIHLVGIGEPLLCKEFFEYVKECTNLGVAVHTTSNLQLVDNDIAKKIVTSGIRYLSFSCDGASEETYSKIRINGTLAKLIKSIKLINDYKEKLNSSYPKLILNFGALNCNIKELPEIIHLAKRLEVEQVIAYHDIIYVKDLEQESLYYNQKESDEMFNKAKEIAEEYGIEYFCPGTFDSPIKYTHKVDRLDCTYPYQHLWIYSDGRVGPCCMDFPERIILGDLNKSTIEEVWNDYPIVELRKSLCKNPYKECLYCAQHGKLDLTNKKYLIRYSDKI